MAGSPLSAPREMRFRWYLQVDKYYMPVKEVCRIFCISKKTYYKWRKHDYGENSNNYISRKDHPSLKLTPEIKLAIYYAKVKYGYGPKKMRRYLEDKHSLSVSTTIIYRYYRKRHLIMKPQKKLPWYHPMKEPYLPLKPGDNIQLDVKYVPSLEGTWNYQFRFLDTFTDMQYAIDCLDKSARSTIYAFRMAKRYFPFEMAGIQTDNGGEFRGLFAIYLNKLGITHRFIPKRSAPWNGKVERANRSVDDEYYLNTNRPWKNLSEYVHWYNYERYHDGKGMNLMTPHQKYQQFLLKSVTLEC